MRLTSLVRRVSQLLWVGVVFAFLVPVLTPGKTEAAPNSELNFQGRLLSDTGALVADGDYHIQFNLYNVDTGGSTLWTETYTGANTLRVANGYFTANLGSLTAFPGTIDWGEELWLTINIGGNAGAPAYDGEMTPRTKVTSVPFAFRAGELQGAAGGYTADELVQLAPTSPQALTDALSAIRIDQSGTGGLLQLQGDSADVFTVDKTGLTTVAGAVDIDGASLDIGSATQSGALIFNDGGGNTLTLQPGVQSGDLTFTLPVADGSSGECLTTDGSGVLAFSACSGGGGGDILDGGNTNTATISIGTNDTFDFNLLADGNVTANFQADGDIDFGGNTLFLDDVNDAVNIAGATTLEALNVNGALNIGNTTNANAGSIRWTGIDFEGFDGSQWKSLTATSSEKGALIYSSSTANVNTAGYTAVPLDNESFKDTGITHDNVTNNSRVTLDNPGRYYISYSVAFDTANNARRSLECAIRLNGTTILQPSQGYDYSRNNTDDNGSISATTAYESTAVNEYYEIVCQQAGTAGTVALLANQSWTLVSTNTGVATVSSEAGIYAYGKVTGATGALAGGEGATVVRNGVGDYSITLGTALADADYTVLLTVAEDNIARDSIVAQIDNQATTGFDVSVHEGDNGGTPGVLRDRDWHFSVITGTGLSSGGAIIQNGNSLGENIVIGTDDTFDLSLETDSALRMTIDSTGAITAFGDVGLQGDVDLGDAATDVITFNGRVGSDILPDTDDTFDLGSATLRWQDLYLGPASLHVVCNAGECGAAQDWALGIDETAGATQGNFRVTLNGSEQLVVSPSGNVGIGDNTPAALFTVGASDALQIDNLGNITTSGGLTISGAIGLSDDISLTGDILGSTAFILQGATDDTFTTSIALQDPTANQTITFPDASGIVCLEGADCGYVGFAPGTVQADATTNNSIFLNKTGASGNILALQRNGSGVFTIANSGATAISVTDAAAFAITDAAGTTTFFNVDTSTGTLQIDSGVTDISGLRFANFNSSTPVSTGQAIGVDASGNIVTIAGGGGGNVLGDYDTALTGTDLDFTDKETYAIADLAGNITLTSSNLTTGNRYNLLIRPNGFNAILPPEVTVISGSFSAATDNHVELEVVSSTWITAKIFNATPPVPPGDQIQANLTTSLTAYNAAAANDWVAITQAEYDLLATNIVSTSRGGASEADYTGATRIYLGNFTFGNTAATLPAGSYVYAFKYSSDTAAVPAGGKFQVSETGAGAGYNQLGNTLPAHNPTANESYFVIKGNNTPTAATGYTAIWTGSNVAYATAGTSGASQLQWFNGDADPSNNFAGGTGIVQALSTTVLQW